tara:strand:- start:408 stop:989 length:582 start_codon:yes stop_codon:yes gene_type:complete
MLMSVKSNIKPFMKKLKKFQGVDIPNITRIAVNETAVRVKELEQVQMRKSFDRPKPQTINSIYVQYAKKNYPIARVTFRDWAQDFIHRNIVGGVRPVTNTAVPTINARLNQFGNIPGRKSGVLKGKQFRATINGIYGVWERNKNGLKIIHRFETNPQYKSIFPFYRVATKAASYVMPIKFEKVAKYYIKKAGY